MVNKFLIATDGKITEKDGFALSDAGEVADYLPITGTVMRSPDFLIFNKDKIDAADPDAKMDLRRASLEVAPTYWPQPGDRVMFSYLANDESLPKVEVDGQMCYIVEYEMLVAQLDPIRPVNGYVLVEMEEETHIDGFELVNHDRNKYGEGVVRFAAPVTRYLDHPDDEDGNVKEGHYVIFNKRHAARMEVDGLHSLNAGKQSSLFKIHRKDILMYGVQS